MVFFNNVQANFALRVYVGIEPAATAVCGGSSDGRCFVGVI
jgi:hypothetical protein